MDYVLIISSYLLALLGVVGAIVPAVPGPPISYIALLLLSFCDNEDISAGTLVVTAILATVITVVDYVAPLWFTKRAGGSAAGMWGATIGLIIGLFFGIIGIVLGPFLGALAGELLSGTPFGKSVKVACINFVAFVFTTGVKMVYSIALAVIIFIEGWRLLWQ